MKEHLNTLYVTSQGVYVRLHNETVAVSKDRKTILRIPLHNLEAIVGFGRVSFSPFLLGACATRGIAVTMLSSNGRFLATVEGYHSGNVLLRRAQYRAADDLQASVAVAAPMVAAKIANCRGILLRASRDQAGSVTALRRGATRLARRAKNACQTTELGNLRGIEGDAARTYFGLWPKLLRLKDEESRRDFRMEGRTRRPPLDRCNALLSFLYVLLMGDCRAAAAASGLDAQAGFLHRDRPGRPSLALDLMEEFRPVLADRTALSLINRRQIQAKDFTVLASAARLYSSHGNVAKSGWSAMHSWMSA